MMNPTDKNYKASLFALLEPTPIDERLVSQMNTFQLQHQSSSNHHRHRHHNGLEADSLAQLSAFLNNNSAAAAAAAIAQNNSDMIGDNGDFMVNSTDTNASSSAYRMQTHESDLGVFCGEAYLKNFDVNDGDINPSNSPSPLSAPRANDFLSAPWFQGLDNMSNLSAAAACNTGEPFYFKAPPSSEMMSPPPQLQLQQHQQNWIMQQPQVQEQQQVSTISAGYASSNTVYSTEPSTSRAASSSPAAPAAMSSLAQSSMMMAALLAEPSFPSASSLADSVFRGEESNNNNNNNNERVPNISDSQCQRWTERYNELVEFKNKHGHCGIPSYWPTNTPLAQWVKRQRYQYKLRNEQRSDRPSTLTDDRIQALEDLGFVWDSHAAFWEERWNELQQFRELNGHTHVPTKYQENPQLGIWCKCQRRQFKIFQTEGPAKSYLTLERIAKLMEIGFVFDPRANSKRRTKKSRATAVSSS